MKKIVQTFLCALLFLSAINAAGQELTGIWRGYFLTEGGEQYKYEVQLDHSKKALLAGVTYSYLDTRFYGKATLTGQYTKSANAALLQEIKTVELKMAGGSVACIMKCRLVYSRSGKEEFLEGVYASAYEKTDAFYSTKKGADCGGGQVFLRKVTTSDFYVEPFLRGKKQVPQGPKPDLPRSNMVKKTTKKLPERTTTANRGTTAPKKPGVKVPVEKPLPVPAETVTTEDVTKLAKPVIAPTVPPMPLQTRDRKNELVKTIVLRSREVELSLYDNGEVDDDTVSIYLDNKLLLSGQRLSTKPILYKLTLDEQNPEHTIVMVAENLGRIPPNTALLIVQDGDRRHQVTITATNQKNAMLRFRYAGGQD